MLFLNFHFGLKLFLICFYFSDDLSLTVLIKCVLNKKKSVNRSLNGTFSEKRLYFLLRGLMKRCIASDVLEKATSTLKPRPWRTVIL